MPIPREMEVELLKEAADVLQATAQERDEALAKVAELELEKRVSKLASDLSSRGLYSGMKSDELTNYLYEAAGQGKLASIEEAAEMVGAGSDLARLDTNGAPTGGGMNAIERFLRS
jgi:hypothetical protein